MVSIAVVVIAGACITAAPVRAQSPERTSRPPLTRIVDIKQAADEADQALPVALEGVVTYLALGGNFFLHDGELGIHVGSSDAGHGLRVGDRVRVTGVTRRGAYAPAIEPREIVRLGTGTLPVPVRAPAATVVTGTLDGQWLQFDGVVCEVGFESSVPGLLLTLAVDGRRLRATVGDAEPIDPETIVDAEVRLRGVASGTFNRQRQLIEPVLRVPGAAYVTVLRKAPADAFAATLVPVRRLLAFSAEAPNPHRVRIRGTVTRCLPDGVMFVRDEGAGLKLKTREPALFADGEIIEAVGFPVMAGGSAVIENAACRVVGHGPAPEPNRAGWPELLDGSHSADLVRVRARLVDAAPAAEGTALILQINRQLVTALLPPALASPAIPESGSILDVTGICENTTAVDPWRTTPSFTLTIARAADLRVVQRPDWWTPSRLWAALGLAGIVIGLGAAWVWTLRREVQRKRAVIEHQARHAARLEERGRIARELHDTLEQGLTAVSLQLKAAENDSLAAPERVVPALQQARRILRENRAVARDVIRELRTDEVGTSLVTGLQRIVATWTQAGISGVTLHVEGEPRALPTETERNLARIATEAVTNAVKHGEATAIELRLEYAGNRVSLRIDDNGAGLANGPAAAAGFGVVGMRERADAIGARFDLTARAGGGTSVVVLVGAPNASWPSSASVAADRPAEVSS